MMDVAGGAIDAAPFVMSSALVNERLGLYHVHKGPKRHIRGRTPCRAALVGPRS